MNNKGNVDDIIRCTSSSFDEMMMQKFAAEAQNELQEQKNKKKDCVIENFMELPKDLIFSVKSVYKLFNRITKTESLINGLQFESYIANNQSLKQKLIEKKIDCYASENYFIKFYKASL